MDGFRNYDAWKLQTPEEAAGYVEYEVFESECGNYFSCHQEEIEAFDKEVSEFLENPEDVTCGVLTEEEVIEDIAAEFKVYSSRQDAEIEYSEELAEEWRERKGRW